MIFIIKLKECARYSPYSIHKVQQHADPIAYLSGLSKYWRENVMYQTIFSGSIITKEGKVRMLYLYSFQFNLLHIFFLILFYLTNSKKYVTSQLREGIASNYYCSVKKI